MEVTIFGRKAKSPLYDLVKFDFIRKKSFAIDLGNTNTLVSDVDNLLVDQPSYIVLDSNRNAVKAVGNERKAIWKSALRFMCRLVRLNAKVRQRRFKLARELGFTSAPSLLRSHPTLVQTTA